MASYNKNMLSLSHKDILQGILILHRFEFKQKSFNDVQNYHS